VHAARPKAIRELTLDDSAIIERYVSALQPAPGDAPARPMDNPEAPGQGR